MSALVNSFMLTVTGGPAGSIQVTGAGTPEADGTYTLTGTHNGKNYYNKSGTNVTISAVTWTSFFSQWEIWSAASTMLYNSTGSDNVATPDLAPSWATSAGSNPVPTVTMN